MCTREQRERIEEICQKIREIAPKVAEFVCEDPAMIAYFIKQLTSSVIAYLEREHNLALEDAVMLIQEGLGYLDEFYFHP
ncbi:MAG: hypothetical protein QW763_05690 [Archaeoglobaceae archaeon]